MDVAVLQQAAWAARLAELWAERLRRQPGLSMCLPTGNTPRPLYAEMSRLVADGRVSFASARVFLFDEFGGLAADDDARCDSMIHRDLLDHVDLPDERLYRLEPLAGDLDAESRRYRNALDQHGLDLSLVGVGRNGHVGLNEPGSAFDAATRRVELTPETQQSAERYGAGTRPRWGLTMGIAELMSSKEIWVLATGERKAAIIAKALAGPVTEEVPVSLLRRHADVHFWLDEPAATQLSS